MALQNIHIKIKPKICKSMCNSICHTIDLVRDEICQKCNDDLMAMISPIAGSLSYKLTSIYIDFKLMEETLHIDFFLKVCRNGEYYILPCLNCLNIRNFASNLMADKSARKATTLDALLLDDRVVSDKLAEFANSKVKETILMFQNGQFPEPEDLQKALPDENKPGEYSVTATKLVTYFRKQHNPDVWNQLSQKYQARDGIRHRSIFWGRINYQVVNSHKLTVKFNVSVTGNYFNKISSPGDFTFEVPISRDIESVAEMFNNVAVTYAETAILKIWDAPREEKYRIVNCRTDKNDELCKGITKIMREYLDLRIGNIDSRFVNARVLWNDSPTCIVRDADQYFLSFSGVQRVPLEPKNKPLLEQHVVDLYDVLSDPEHALPPAHEGQWIRFAEYLVKEYERQLSAENLLKYAEPIKLRCCGTACTISVGENRMVVKGNDIRSDGKFAYYGSESLGDYASAADLAATIVAATIEIVRKLNFLDPWDRVNHAEAQILAYLKQHPNSTMTTLKQHILIDDVLAKSIPDLVDDLKNKGYISAATTSNRYGYYELLFIDPQYKRVDFSSVVRPYDIDDINYLKPEYRISVVRKAFISMTDETLSSVLEALHALSKKDVLAFCQDEKVQAKLLKLSPCDSDFVRTTLTQVLGSKKQVQGIFTERDIAKLEALTANKTLDGAESLCDFLAETDSQLINTFFKSDTGKQYLEDCPRESLEMLADTLFCIQGCKLLYNRVDKQLEKIAKTTE